MKIAILVPNFLKLDGGARVAELQAEQLASIGHDVVIFALTADIKPKSADLFIMGLPRGLFWQRLYRLIFPLDLFTTLRWLPRLKSYDLVIAHLYPLTWLACLAKKIYKVKYTFWYHGITDPKLYPHLYERVFWRMQILLTRLTVGNADHAASVSKFAQGELKKYTGLDSEVVYNRINVSRFRPGITGAGIREKHDLGNSPVVLSVGRVCPQKGYHLLLQAFKLVKQEIPDAKLVIVGAHTYSYYSRMLKEMSDDSVIFAGHVGDDVPLYYAMCDLYANCSLWESFNLPLAEAQACDKPVVAFNIGPHPEIVNENGTLVEAGNIKEFAQVCVEKLKG